MRGRTRGSAFNQIDAQRAAPVPLERYEAAAAGAVHELVDQLGHVDDVVYGIVCEGDQ